LAALVVFLISLAVVVRTRGGLSPTHAQLADAPLLGALFPVKEEAEGVGAPAEGEEGGILRPGRQVPFLRFGPEARLQKLAQELTAKKSEYDSLLRQVERRSRELDAWERQMKKERDDLLSVLRGQEEDLGALQQELARKEEQLAALQIAIEQAEEDNLKSTADIYGKMASERAAEILTQMYGDGEQETVVKIIYLMQDRSAAKLLESITDPKIGADITGRLKRITQTEQQTGG
jgi:flagellar motility protein MotE (MotC chaperone)